jgi:methylene-fatty-acyl-phospholipid synthase
MYKLLSAGSTDLVDFSQKSLYISALAILFNPFFWNVVARNEHAHKTLTRLFGHRPQIACYALALTIFSLGLFRDFLYERALRHQPLHSSFHHPQLAYLLLLIGNTLVFSSIYALGLTGTYLGDYFGILMDEPVTAFPFNITGAPMYYGSSLSFLGTALLYGRPAGVLLSGLVFGVYKVALGFEDPFTSEIYAKRDRERLAKGKGREDGKKLQ